MDQSPDPAAAHDGERPLDEHRHDVEVRVRRAPRYGVFLAIGAVVGALVAWLIALLQPPALNGGGDRVDTTAVIGLVVVGGFVLGAAAGGIVALLVDRSLSKRARTLTAEQLDIAEASTAQSGGPEASTVRPGTSDRGVDGPADAGDVAFERVERADDESQERDRPGGA